MRSTESAAARAPRVARGASKFEQRRQLEHAVELLRTKQLDKAALALQAVLQRWPGQGDALHYLGVLKHQAGDSDAAVALIRQAIDAMPNEVGPWNNLGNVLVEAQRFAEAEAAYRRCLELQPTFVDALSNLATIHSKRGEHAEAEAMCRRAIAARPEFGQAWYNLSVALLAQKRIDEGLAANSHAILLWPKHLQARDAVARALVFLGRLDEAAKLYREWLTVDPDNAVIQHHLAACSGGAVPERASDAYVERTFDAFAATFDANLTALGYRAPQLVADLLRELLPAPARQFDIHDLGCGTGLCGPLVRDWARELSGCDLSSGMLKKAERRQIYDRLDHTELVAHLLANPLRFDALICADTLCYFGELGEALRASAQALRPGGTLVFTVEANLADDAAPYHLQSHGRYAHRRDYLEQALAQADLALCTLRQETLRHEAGRPVIGWLVAARLSTENTP
ncbi:MAG: tetratricopeptide repeat protein [Burkholderiaceae bacterium]